jgi:hypothetical protein
MNPEERNKPLAAPGGSRWFWLLLFHASANFRAWSADARRFHRLRDWYRLDRTIIFAALISVPTTEIT